MKKNFTTFHGGKRNGSVYSGFFGVLENQSGVWERSSKARKQLNIDFRINFNGKGGARTFLQRRGGGKNLSKLKNK